MQELLHNIENAKSIAEHISIILTYQNTGFLAKEKAIEIYKSFNYAHTDYTIIINTKSVITDTLIQIVSATDRTIIDNLRSQVLWATSEEYLKNIGITLQ